MKDGPRFYIGTVCIQSGRATNQATVLGVWIPKMWVWEGAIDVSHKTIVNNQNIKVDFQNNFEFIFIDFKHHRNRKCLPFIELSN